MLTLRRNYGHYLGSRQSTPLPLNAHLVLVPIKMHYTLIDNDSVTGFVNACNVTGLDAVESADSDTFTTIGKLVYELIIEKETYADKMHNRETDPHSGHGGSNY